MEHGKEGALSDARRMQASRCDGQTGASLLEVLIALTISGLVFSSACETWARFGPARLFEN
jgi:prepilin-type N-terminal cleavage/methylation domain-containing protein